MFLGFLVFYGKLVISIFIICFYFVLSGGFIFMYKVGCDVIVFIELFQGFNILKFFGKIFLEGVDFKVY